MGNKSSTSKSVSKDPIPTPIKSANFPDGSVYDGESLNGKRHGQGKATYGNGDTYEGSWVSDARNGFGKYFSSGTGRIYEGNWVNGTCEGQGTLTEPNGDVYIGAFVANKKEGRGALHKTNGEIVDGVWKANALVSIITEEKRTPENKSVEKTLAPINIDQNSAKRRDKHDAFESYKEDAPNAEETTKKLKTSNFSQDENQKENNGESPKPAFESLPSTNENSMNNSLLNSCSS
jgi:hypothetical protein